jgi:hypothetical protein
MGGLPPAELVCAGAGDRPTMSRKDGQKTMAKVLYRVIITPVKYSQDLEVVRITINS